jgi:hypothetical protein
MGAPAKWAFVIAAVLGSACGGASTSGKPSFREAPLVVIPSDAMKLSIEVRTAPDQPPERGVAAVQLVVKDETGAPVDGLDVATLPWMPAMGHGTSVLPTASMQGKGTYVLDNVYLYMPGHWELRTSFSGTVTDRATPTFEVP